MEKEIMVGQLEVGDLYQEYGMDRVRVNKIGWHGDTVLVWGDLLDDDMNHLGDAEHAIDMDTVVVLLARGDFTAYDDRKPA